VEYFSASVTKHFSLVPLLIIIYVAPPRVGFPLTSDIAGHYSPVNVVELKVWRRTTAPLGPTLVPSPKGREAQLHNIFSTPVIKHFSILSLLSTNRLLIWKNYWLGFALRHRSFPLVEGEGGWGFLTPCAAYRKRLSTNDSRLSTIFALR